MADDKSIETKLRLNNKKINKNDISLCFRRGGLWAFRQEGSYYCFMQNKKPDCAEDESKMITRKLYSSSRWFKETERYYICEIKNRENSEDGRGKI